MTKGRFFKAFTQGRAELRKFAVAYVDEASAEDVIQEVVGDLLENPNIITKINDSQKTFLSWMKTRIKLHIKRHIWRNARTEDSIEQNSIMLSQLLDTNEEGYHQAEPDDSPPLLEAAVRAALETLNPLEHDVILCRVFAAMPWEEIRLKLDRPVPTLRSAYQRGLQKLRLYLQSVGISATSFADSRHSSTDQNAA